MQIDIGVCRERVAYWEHVDSVKDAERFAIMNGISTGMIYDNPTYIHLGRSRIAKVFLKRPESTHLCYVDSDNVLPTEAFLALAQRDLPIVGATYFGRRMSPEVIARNWTDVKRHRSKTVSKQVRELILEHELPVVNRPQYIEGAPLLKVDVIGFGCTMIKREVLETLSDKCDYMFGGHGQDIGEDVSFCAHAQDAGYEIYLDLGVQLGHLKTYDMTVADFMTVPEWFQGD